jgi:hypothetical protein
MEELAEYNIQKNFTDVPTFLKFLRTSKARTQIGMFRPIRMDHTNCLQLAIKTHHPREDMISRLSNSAFQGQVSLD